MKISTKINVILNLIKSVENIIIVGAMANNFLVFKGLDVGKSLVEHGAGNIIEKFTKKLKILIVNTYPRRLCGFNNFEGNGK